MLRQSARAFSTTAAPRLARMSLIGTIGSDLEKRTTSTGKDFIKYSVAVNSKNKNEQLTSWFNVACFAPAQINFMTTYLGKGAKVYVEADVSNTPYEKTDGSKSTSLMLFQTNVEVIRFPKKEEGEGESA
ncbi:DEKNAAC100472 [Brettanomyces naardenensis]|uniref:Single-stranded DNA-binding protein n=1 Tax=Brettanomyces naardenensis TaxID=13370 RepID=A0A448YFT9_BRENA|nr:DEKNAAC100472 [Brettanomyces naardenensis]